MRTERSLITDIKDNILWTYYQGVAERLRAEVDLINKVISHDGSMGEANERLLQNLVRKFIPARYGVGSGVVVDHKGKQSRQCDIVIYDPLLYPSLFALGEVHLFPVDFVYGVVEVKTTLDSSKVKTAIANIESVKRLDIIPGDFVVWKHAGIARQSPTSPMGFVFGFQSRSGTNKSGEIVAPKFETFVEWWIPEDPAHRAYGPNLVCALDQGVARYVEIPVGPKTPFRGLACILCDDESKSITVPPGTDQVIWGRLQYPIREVEGNRMPIDPGKSLLYFLMMMNQLLTMRHIKPDIELHEHYIKGGLRSTIIVER